MRVGVRTAACLARISLLAISVCLCCTEIESILLLCNDFATVLFSVFLQESKVSRLLLPLRESLLHLRFGLRIGSRTG